MLVCVCARACMCWQLAHLVLKYSLVIVVIVPHFISFFQVVPLLLRAAGFMAAVFLTVSEMKYQANNRVSGNVNCKGEAILFGESPAWEC